jgi:hypothetical protein
MQGRLSHQIWIYIDVLDQAGGPLIICKPAIMLKHPVSFCCRTYIALFDKPAQSDLEDADGANSGLSALERKKLRAKQRKAEAKAKKVGVNFQGRPRKRRYSSGDFSVHGLLPCRKQALLCLVDTVGDQIKVKISEVIAPTLVVHLTRRKEPHAEL